MSRAAGYGGRVLINDTVLYANKWSVDYTLETDDGTSTHGNQNPLFNPANPQSYRLNTKRLYPKVAEISINFEAFYDTSHGWLTASAQNGGFFWGLIPGREVRIHLFPATHLRNTALWYFQQALIVQCTQTVEVRQIVKINFSAKNNGPNYTINV